MSIKIDLVFKVSKSISIFIFILNFSVLYAQRDTLYIDENGKSTSKKIFNNKLNSSIYYGMKYVGDTLVLQEINYRYRFGKLMPITKSQLFKLLNKTNGIDTTKAMVIHYIDTLPSKSKFPKHNKIVNYDSLGNEIKKPIESHGITDGVVFDLTNLRKIAKHVHVQNYRKFISSHKSCVRKYNKYKKDSFLFHFYNYNGGHPNEVKQLKWYQDYGGLLKKNFIRNENQFNLLMIKPTGEFLVYCNDDHFNNNHVTFENLLDKDEWERTKISFEKEFEALNKTN